MVGNVYETMVKQACAAIAGQELLLLSIARSSKTAEDGSVTNNVVIEAEVPRGQSGYSRCRIRVKCPDAPLPVTEGDLEDSEFTVVFEGLRLTYIDARKNVYFAADLFHVSKEV